MRNRRWISWRALFPSAIGRRHIVPTAKALEPRTFAHARASEDRAARVAIGYGSVRGRVTVCGKPIRRSVTASMDVMGFRRGPRLGPPPDPAAPIGRADVVQPRAIPRWVGPGGVMPVKRTNAIMLTAMAPITEKTVCYVGDGIAI